MTVPIRHVVCFILIVASAAGCTAPASAPASASASAPGAPQPVRIGVLLPTAGVYGQLGPDILAGMDLYFEEVGATAGGRPIELVSEDEPTDPNAGLEAVRRLLDQDLDLLTGIVSSAVAYAARDLLVEEEMPTVVSNAGGNELTAARRSPYIFRTSFTSEQIHAPLGTWVAENIGPRVAIVASDYAFGQESAAAFRATYEAAGGQVVSETFTPLGSNDFANAIAAVAGADVDATFGFLAGSDGVIFVQQYASADLKDDKPLTVSGFMVDADIIDAVGDSALGAISAMHYAPTLDNPTNQRFVQAFRAAHARTPSVYVAQGYDAAQLIVKGIAAAGGSTEPDDLIAGMEAAVLDSPRGPVRIDAVSHQIIQHMYLREVREVDGALTNVVIADLGEIGPDPLP